MYLMKTACIRLPPTYGDNDMSRTVYLNGDYLPEEDAKISIFDRSFLMADGVYEVTSVLGGKLIDFDGHHVRLERSLNELGMQKPEAFDDLLDIHRELVRLNDIDEGMIYLQVSRGSAGDRDFAYPSDDEADACVVYAIQARFGQQPCGAKGHESDLDRGSAVGAS